MLNLMTDIIVRVCIITSIFSIISFYLMRRYAATPGRLSTRIPLLFVVFGVVILINILYVLGRYDVLNPS